MHSSTGSMLDIWKYRDTCERSITILHGIAILRYIDYQMRRTVLDDISKQCMYRTIRYLQKSSISKHFAKPRYRGSYYRRFDAQYRTRILVSLIAKRFLAILKYRGIDTIQKVAFTTTKTSRKRDKRRSLESKTDM